MAKKKTKTIDVVTEANVLDVDKNVEVENVLNKQTVINHLGEISSKREHGKIKYLDINELVALEKACSILCKRFETTAQLDYAYHSNFKEFQKYYEMIFNELKERVIMYCSND